MVVYQRRLVSAERLERAFGARWVDWDQEYADAEVFARDLARHEYETGLRTFPVSIVPDRLKRRRVKAKPRIPSRRDKGRRPQEPPSDTFGA